MLQKLKIDTLSRNYNLTDSTTSVTIDWDKLLYVGRCILLFALPIGAIALSITTNYLFLKEILSATFLMVLILFVKIAGGRS